MSCCWNTTICFITIYWLQSNFVLWSLHTKHIYTLSNLSHTNITTDFQLIYLHCALEILLHISSTFITLCFTAACFITTCLWRWDRQCVLKHWYIKCRHQGITHMKEYNNCSLVCNRQKITENQPNVISDWSSKQNECWKYNILRYFTYYTCHNTEVCMSQSYKSWSVQTNDHLVKDQIVLNWPFSYSKHTSFYTNLILWSSM
jgi:hypothetical protein